MEKSQPKAKMLKNSLSILQDLRKPVLLGEEFQPLRLDGWMETQEKYGVGA